MRRGPANGRYRQEQLYARLITMKVLRFEGASLAQDQNHPMSELGRCCRKSRKSKEAKNLANIDFRIIPPLRCSVAPIRRSVVAFLRSEVVPYCARNASAVLENFVCFPEKTFSTASVKIGSRGPSAGCQPCPRKRTSSGRLGMSQTCQQLP